MTKGIRQYVEQRFTKLLPKLADMGGHGFRQKVINDTVTQFDTTVASAAAAYNFVINKMREENPDAVAGLGRTEAGLNVVSANAGRASKRRIVGRPVGNNVTLIRARDGARVGEAGGEGTGRVPVGGFQEAAG